MQTRKEKKNKHEGIKKNKNGDWVYYRDAWPYDKERHVEMTYIIDGNIPKAFALEIGERKWNEELRYYERMKYDDKFREEIENVHENHELVEREDVGN